MHVQLCTLIFAPFLDSSSPDPSPKPSIKFLTSHWHLQGIKRILRNIICVEFIYLSHDSVAIWLMRFRKQQKLDTSGCLKASQSEVGAFENLKAGQLRARYGGRYWGGRKGTSDCMHSVEGAGEHKVVIRGQFGQGRREVAVIDEAAGFVNDYESVYDPVGEHMSIA